MQLLASKLHHFLDSRELQTAQEMGGEMENVRQAWQWALDHMETKWILEAGRSLHNIIQFQSRYLEGVDLFLQTSRRLETDQMTVERGSALVEILTHYSWFCIRLGRLDEADRALARACQLYEALHISPAQEFPVHQLIGYPFFPLMFLALARGDYKQATIQGEKILQLVEKHGPPVAAIFPHYGMASAFLAQDDYVRAKAHAAQSLALAGSVGHRRGMAYSHGILGRVALVEGDLQTAKRHFEAANRIYEEYAEPSSMAEHLANLADVALRQQEWPEARQLFSQSHALYEELGDRGGIARTRLGMGIIAQNTDELDAARIHFGHALEVAVDGQIVPVILSIATAVGDFLLLGDDTRALGLHALSFVYHHPSCDGQTRQQITDSLARSGVIAHELEPIPEPLDEVVAELQNELAAPPVDTVQIQSLVEPLTERELEVLRLLAAGRSNPEIAEELIVAEGTIKSHASRIYRKLDVTNRTQAVVRARELGLLA
jgi:ATP/maltotriose-dependent transcriptional regulator MalT